MQESYEWIVDNIKSSRNEFHLTCCYTLLQLFKLRYKEECNDLAGQLLLDIRTKEIEISLTA